MTETNPREVEVAQGMLKINDKQIEGLLKEMNDAQLALWGSPIRYEVTIDPGPPIRYQVTMDTDSPTFDPSIHHPEEPESDD